MVIHDNFVFVANPRTASRSHELVLKELLGDTCHVTKIHHPPTNHPELVSGKPVIGVIRNPYDWIISWYHHAALPNMTLVAFLKEVRPSWLFKDDLNIYREYITNTALFEAGVVRNCEIITGKAYEATPPVIGLTGPEPELWTPEARELARKRFPRDFEHYQ